MASILTLSGTHLVDSMDNAVSCFDISFDQTHWVVRPAVNTRLAPAYITKHTQAYDRYKHPLHIPAWEQVGPSQ